MGGLGEAGDDPPALSVSEVNAQIRDLVEGVIPPLWVRGEIVDFRRQASGHCYFGLKDAGSQLRAVLWRQTAERVKFQLHDGLEVLAHGRLSVYLKRGEYQLNVSQMQPFGLGPLELEFRRRFERFKAEGLFDPERKRPLPQFPKRVAFVTSPTGAAVQDFLEVLGRRFPGTDVLVVPARVQGEGAARDVARALAMVNRAAAELGVELVVVGRGGGSQEDLWAFNEEVVVRAIAASELPVVSAVGHEIDVTLADFVADRRALTPSEAAELVVPSRDETAARLGHWADRLRMAVERKVRRASDRLEQLARRRVLTHPQERYEDLARRVDELAERARRGVLRRKESLFRRTLDLAGRLEALSPLSILSRGYSLTFHEPTGRRLRSAAEASPGDLLRTRLQDGEVFSVVTPSPPSPSSPAGDASSAG